MLVFAAITPHTPLLIAEIGKDNAAKLTASIASLKTLEAHLYAAQPDCVIVLSSATDHKQTSFVINFAPQFTGSFAEFGHFNDKPTYYGNNALSYQLKERVETHLPVSLTTITELDYNILTPLHYLLAHRKPTTIIPIHGTNRSLAEHLECGVAIAEEIVASSHRIAVIASAETSHTLRAISPGGFKAGAKAFDRRVVKLITEQKTNELLQLPPEELAAYAFDELPVIMMLLGILTETNCRAKLLSHESPFGIGHVTMEFEM